MKTIAIAGSGTDVGKTFFACRLIEDLRAQGRNVVPRKPVVSGVDDADVGSSDTDRLIAAAGLTIAARNAVSPWRFTDPVAPNEAARRARVKLKFDAIVAACAIDDDDDRNGETAVIVETAGGVMSPLTDDTTQLALLQVLAAPVFLVVDGSYLGWLSHTLTALFSVREAGLDVLAVVVNRGGDVDALRRFTSIPVVGIHARELLTVLASVSMSTPRPARTWRGRDYGGRVD